MTPRGVDFDPQDPLTRALRAMPAPRAPKTLAPKVMAAVRARLAAPPARTWFDWPPVWRVASVAGAMAVLIGLMWAWPLVQTQAGAAWDAALTNTVELRSALGLGISLLAAAGRTLGPVVTTFFLCVTALAMVCAVVGAALGRVALGGLAR